MAESDICKRFNVFITKVILNASIDYKRKLFKAVENELVIISEIENEISSSGTDEGIFSFIDENVASNELERVFAKEEHYSAMKQLTDKQKEILDLLVVKKLSVKEVAKMLGTTESNVKVTKLKAIRKFKQNLKRRND